MTAIRHEVEDLRLHACLVYDVPFQVLSGQLRVRRLLGLLSDRLDGGRPVDGLLGTGHIGQPIIEQLDSRSDTSLFNALLCLLLLRPSEHIEGQLLLQVEKERGRTSRSEEYCASCRD